MAKAICSLCSQAVEPDDYHRQLDCSRNCVDNVFHEPCIEKYLRKNGRGTEQKTGFSCPATLPNGKPCLGTVKKTHMRLPANIKKKEQNKQTAIAVNLLVNTARAGPPAVAASKGKDSAAMMKLVPKVAARVVKVVTGQRPPIVVCNRNTGTPVSGDSGGGDEPLEEDFTNFRQIGKRIPKRYEDNDTISSDEPSRLRTRHREKAFEAQDQLAWLSRSATSGAKTKPSAAAMAVSKKSDMAPEPVTRQKVIPGWTEPQKGPASVSNLAEQRALVAALRAQVSSSSANRAVSAAAAGTSGGASRAASGTGCMDKLEAQDYNAKLNSPRMGVEAGGGGGPQPTRDIATASDAATRVTANNEIVAKTILVGPCLSTEDHEGERSLHRSSSGWDTASVTASPGTTESPSPASPEANYYVDTDPIVEYIQLFSVDDDTVVVHDKLTGMFVRMEDVYGTDPELIGFEDETGAVTYYIVIRASSLAAQQQQLEAGLGERNLGGPGGDDVAIEGASLAQGGLAYGHGGDGAEKGGVPMPVWDMSGGVPPAAGGEGGEGEADNDDFDDLLALCLG